MATRNLARTAVEGGRKRGLERFQTRTDRQLARQYLKRIGSVDHALDAGALPPKRWQDYDSGFTDHLKPTERWLESRAGRRWDDVWSELCRRYDRRTLKGYHLLDHVWRHMVEHAQYEPIYRSYHRPPYGAWVDADGILRYMQKYTWWKSRKKKEE